MKYESKQERPTIKGLKAQLSECLPCQVVNKIKNPNKKTGLGALINLRIIQFVTGGQ